MFISVIVIPSPSPYPKSIMFSSPSPLYISPSDAPKTLLGTCCPRPHSSLISSKMSHGGLICKAEKEYKFPDPIPEFADSETEKFKTHLLNKLSKKKEMYGDSVDEVVVICTAILFEFLNTEYGGPGTLLVNPFIDMADTINEKGLPGGPQAARAAVKWAQAHVDNDWKEWTN